MTIFCFHFHFFGGRGHALVASRAVHIFLALSPQSGDTAALIQELLSYGFPRKLRVGLYGSHDKNFYLFSTKNQCTLTMTYRKFN